MTQQESQLELSSCIEGSRQWLGERMRPLPQPSNGHLSLSDIAYTTRPYRSAAVGIARPFGTLLCYVRGSLCPQTSYSAQVHSQPCMPGSVFTTTVDLGSTHKGSCCTESPSAQYWWTLLDPPMYLYLGHLGPYGLF